LPQVKAETADLADQQQPGYFRKYGNMIRKGGKSPEIMLAWNKKTR